MEAFLAILGAIMGGVQLFSGLNSQAQQLELQQQQSGINNLLAVNDLRGSLGQIGTGIQEADFNIGSYEEFLNRFPEAARLETDTYAAQGEGQLDALLGNLGLQNVAGSVRGIGRDGATSTASVMAGHARGDVVRFAGEDMALGGDRGNAGLYERGLSELTANLDAQRRSAEGQLGIWHTTRSTLLQSQGDTQGALSAILWQIDPTTGQFIRSGGDGTNPLWRAPTGNFDPNYHPMPMV